ncbi:MAG: GNAT family N-acetyltransferase [Anaerolineae bacterium]|jgi:GNAT superfamily N-acetyltransferase|nr:GNAT family N-acetyltransferase [Anaerolineae bacterium]
MSDAVIADSSTLALVDLIDENLIEKSLSFPRVLRGEIHGPDPLWFMTGSALPHYNGVVRATFGPETVREGVEAVVKPFKEKGLPFIWWVGPLTAPRDLGTHLQAQGLTHNRDMIGMAAKLSALTEVPGPAANVTFEPVCDRDQLALWYEVFLRGFPTSFDQAYLDALVALSLRSDPAWFHYLGRLDGRVVTISSLFVGGGSAGLYNLATLPEARGLGLGAWMTQETFHQARLMGHMIGTLQTTYPNALRLYHRLGFEVYCKIGIYQYVPKS